MKVIIGLVVAAVIAALYYLIHNLFQAETVLEAIKWGALLIAVSAGGASNNRNSK